MALKISTDTRARWTGMAEGWLRHNRSETRYDVMTGKDAWNIAHQCHILREAYNDRTVIDAHIQTALEDIFPNAVFLDRKVY